MTEKCLMCEANSAHRSLMVGPYDDIALCAQHHWDRWLARYDDQDPPCAEYVIREEES